MNEDVLDMLRTERECVSRDCDRECGKCDLAQERCWLLDMYDRAIELLTPIKPTFRCGRPSCGHCGCGLHRIVERNNFCPNCGKAVDWWNA